MTDGYFGAIPSVIVYNLLAATLGKLCTSPLGHLIVSDTEVAPKDGSRGVKTPEPAAFADDPDDIPF